MKLSKHVKQGKGFSKVLLFPFHASEILSVHKFE